MEKASSHDKPEPAQAVQESEEGPTLHSLPRLTQLLQRRMILSEQALSRTRLRRKVDLDGGLDACRGIKDGWSSSGRRFWRGGIVLEPNSMTRCSVNISERTWQKSRGSSNGSLIETYEPGVQMIH